MYLGSLIHRQRLFELTTRWFAGHLEPEDGTFLTELFAYERLLLEPPLRRLLSSLVEAPEARWRRVVDKDELRKTLCADGRGAGLERVESLRRRYREEPLSLFQRTPADLLVLERREDERDDQRELLGMLKVKRLRRLSQRSARLVGAAIAARVRRAARKLARQRAGDAGVPLDGFFTPPESMAAEFAHAEEVVAQAIRSGELRFSEGDLSIDDVLGLCLVANDDEHLEALEARLLATPGASFEALDIPRPDTAEGRHYAVELPLPDVDALLAPLAEIDWSTTAAHRGLDGATLAAGLEPYAASGARCVRVEVSLTTFASLFELELGDSPPEARIAEERFAVHDRGRIAENVAYLIEYLLMVAVSPRSQVESLPIRVDGRYIPDTVALTVGELFSADPPGAASFCRLCR